jgi:hypothetical protein
MALYDACLVRFFRHPSSRRDLRPRVSLAHQIARGLRSVPNDSWGPFLDEPNDKIAIIPLVPRLRKQ